VGERRLGHCERDLARAAEWRAAVRHQVTVEHDDIACLPSMFDSVFPGAAFAARVLVWLAHAEAKQARITTVNRQFIW